MSHFLDCMTLGYLIGGLISLALENYVLTFSFFFGVFLFLAVEATTSKEE